MTDRRSKKRASASLTMFCTPTELAKWITTFCSERKHSGVAFISESLVAVELSNDVLLSPSLYRAFLFPETEKPLPNLSMNDVRARSWGWVDVWPGRIVGGAVTLTRIVAEDFEGVPIQPVREVRWLKRRLSSVLTRGVRGRNVVTGGYSDYYDIAYTGGALDELSRGLTWKQEVSDRAVFEPLVA